MASVFFISSTSSGAGDALKDPDHVSTDAAFTGATVSPNPTDVFELRVGNATTVPTQRQVLNWLESVVERWYRQNGLNGLGANLPPNRG